MEELGHYREEIDALDVQLLDLFAKRFEIVRAVGRLKAEKNIPVVQSQRVVEVIDRAERLAKERNVDPEFIRNLYTSMIDLAHVMEHKIVEDHD